MREEQVKISTMHVLNKDLKDNIELVVDMADEYYGTERNINITVPPNDAKSMLEERKFFIESAFEILNKFSLHMAIIGVDDD